MVKVSHSESLIIWVAESTLKTAQSPYRTSVAIHAFNSAANLNFRRKQKRAHDFLGDKKTNIFILLDLLLKMPLPHVLITSAWMRKACLKLYLGMGDYTSSRQDN